MCRDILNTCVRNTEEAERISQAASSGRGLGRGVWGMIEESELAKTFKKGEEKKVWLPHTWHYSYAHAFSKVDEDLVLQAKYCLGQLEDLIARVQSSPAAYDTSATELVDRSNAALVMLADVIQVTSDPIRMEELFYVNDSITNALTQLDEARRAPIANGHGSNGSGASTPHGKASTGVGLGLSTSPEIEESKTESELDDTAGEQADDEKTRIDAKLNGLRLHIPTDISSASEPYDTESESEALETPRIDKGKGRAAPEPEVIEKVLSPNFVLSSSDDEDDEEKKAPTDL